MEQRFLLELDGRLAGRFFDFALKGGGIKAVVTLVSHPSLITPEHLNVVEFQEMVLAVGRGSRIL